MEKNNIAGFNYGIFQNMPIIGIMRNVTLDHVKHILPLYAKAGLTTLEITMNSNHAEEIISYAVKEYGSVLNIGAGTVCNRKDLNRALEAGAQFIVMPVVNKGVIKDCVSNKTPVFPGAFTPTEVLKAWKLGATMVKVFPAEVLGSRYIKEILAPLNEVQLLATGGISLDNIESYLAAGTKGFGIGSPLFVKRYIEEKDWDSLSIHFKNFVSKINGFKQK